MKLIIAGDRDWYYHDLIRMGMRYHDLAGRVTEVVCGMADGIDKAGKKWAEDHSIPVKEFKADWYTYKLNAGPIRNKQMVEYADALLLIWDGESKGSKDVWTKAYKAGLPIYEMKILTYTHNITVKV